MMQFRLQHVARHYIIIIITRLTKHLELPNLIECERYHTRTGYSRGIRQLFLFVLKGWMLKTVTARTKLV